MRISIGHGLRTSGNNHNKVLPYSLSRLLAPRGQWPCQALKLQCYACQTNTKTRQQNRFTLRGYYYYYYYILPCVWNWTYARFTIILVNGGSGPHVTCVWVSSLGLITNERHWHEDPKIHQEATSGTKSSLSNVDIPYAVAFLSKFV